MSTKNAERQKKTPCVQQGYAFIVDVDLMHTGCKLIQSVEKCRYRNFDLFRSRNIHIQCDGMM
jgi:hypothetical protein